MEDSNLIDSLQQELKEKHINIENVNILFLDISSACTGYSIINLDFKGKRAKLTKAGALWLDPKWSHQEKYSYMFHVVATYFWIVEQIDYIVVEQYSVNPAKLMGINVVSEMQGAIKAAAWENGVKVVSILPQTWRSILKIKAVKTGKTRDYKTPTKNYIDSIATIPQEVISNITNSVRKTPSDLYDAIAISLAWTQRLGFRIDTSDIKINEHIGHALGRA
jgi:hypothetical protein